MPRSYRIVLCCSRDLDQSSAWGRAIAALEHSGHDVALSFLPINHDSGVFRGDPLRLPNNVREFDESMLPVSRQAVQLYSDYLGSPEYAMSRSTLMLMLSRLDSTGTFRSLDREVLLRKVHLQIFSAIADSNPTFGLFDVTPHEVFDFALMGALEWCRVPLLMFQPSLVGPQVMARTSLVDRLPIALGAESVVRNKSVLDKIYGIAEASVERLSEGTGTPKMDNQKAKEASIGSISSRISSVFYALKRLIVPGPDTNFSLTGHTEIPGLFRRALELMLEWSLRKSLRKRIDDLASIQSAPDRRFALFALHYEPERSSIPEGYPFDSQLDAVLAVRKFLPVDVHLYVKEHFSQKAAALRGLVGRSPDAYGLLESVPGVTVLGVETNTRALIRAAECVFTLTGKVGIEAALEEVPVVYLGQPWWEEMPGARKFDAAGRYSHLISARAPAAEAIRGWLSHQIRFSLLPGLASVPPATHSKRIAQLPPGFEAVEAEGIIAAVHAVMAQAGKASQDT